MTPPNTPGDEPLAADDLESLFRFDAFAPREEDEQEPDAVTDTATPPPVEGKQAAEATPGEQGADEAPAEEVVAPEPVVAPQDPERELLRRTVDEQRQQIQELMALQRAAMERAVPAAQQAGQAPAPTRGQDSEQFPYNFQVPDQLMEMIDSENPTQRRAGISALITSLARVVHGEVRKEFTGKLEEVSKSIPRTIESHVDARSSSERMQQAVESDFYGTYTELNRPELKPLIVSTAARIMSTTGAKDWSPALRDQIGTEVRAILRASSGLAGAPAAGNGQVARPPKQRGTTTRPPAGPTGLEGEIDDLIFGGF